MTSPEAEEPVSSGGRGRVVMLVDNDVRRDSRVQKAAFSMAAKGWDVVLLGKAKGRSQERWRLGDARVRLLPVERTLARRSHEMRTPWVRDPLAYPPGPTAEHRKQALAARSADLAVRRAARPDGPGTWSRRARVSLRRRWVDLRVRHTESLRTRRKELDSAIDRATTAGWQRVLGTRAWRRLDPHLWDFELAYGPIIDALQPDLVHANDWVMLGVGARAKLRGIAEGRRVGLVWDAHEFLPEMKPWNSHPRWHPAQLAHEAEYAPYADAVVTVSETVAELLQREHGLSVRPHVVMNCPVVAPGSRGQAPSLRKAAGLDPEVPILVYSGQASPARGLDTMVEALPELREVACVFVVSKPNSDYVQSLVSRAEQLGVADRVHLLPFVPYDQVVAYLSSADIGVIPIERGLNEIALNTKFFEYSHARLPLVCSDVKVMAEQVRETGQGEVYAADDLADFVRAARRVLADPAAYRSAYDAPGLLEGWTWDAQADVLEEVYDRVSASRA